MLLLRALDATSVRVDLLDAPAVRTAVLESEPEAIVHQATALANVKFGRNFDKISGLESAKRKPDQCEVRLRVRGVGKLE